MTALDAYRRTEIVSAGDIGGDGSGSTSSGPKDVYTTVRFPYLRDPSFRSMQLPARWVGIPTFLGAAASKSLIVVP